MHNYAATNVFFPKPSLRLPLARSGRRNTEHGRDPVLPPDTAAPLTPWVGALQSQWGRGWPR